MKEEWSVSKAEKFDVRTGGSESMRTARTNTRAPKISDLEKNMFAKWLLVLEAKVGGQKNMFAKWLLVLEAKVGSQKNMFAKWLLVLEAKVAGDL